MKNQNGSLNCKERSLEKVWRKYPHAKQCAVETVHVRLFTERMEQQSTTASHYPFENYLHARIDLAELPNCTPRTLGIVYLLYQSLSLIFFYNFDIFKLIGIVTGSKHFAAFNFDIS